MAANTQNKQENSQPFLWHADCSCMLSWIVMKRPVFNPNFDRNWAWPEKTWFRERLNAVKAREREGHRKPGDRPQNPTPIEAKPSDDTIPEKS
jgi:hypothetical protein